MLVRIAVTAALSMLSVSASALTLIGENEIVNLSTSANPSPVVNGRTCKISSQKNYLGLSEAHILAALSQAKCRETNVDQAQLDRYLARFNDKMKFQLLSATVIAHVVDTIWAGLTNSSLTIHQLAETGFTFKQLPGVDDLTDFRISVAVKSDGRLSRPTKDDIKSAFINSAKALKMEMRFSDLYMAAASNKVDSATDDELVEIKAALGLN